MNILIYYFLVSIEMHTDWRGMKLNEIVKNTRKYLGITQCEFANTINKSQMMISKYESGAVPPASDIIIHCMNILDKKEALEELKVNKLGDIPKAIQEEWIKIKQNY